MNLNHILNADAVWEGAVSSSHRPEPLGFTSISHEYGLRPNSHRVNARSLQPQSEHKRNETLFSLPSISSFDTHYHSLPNLNRGFYQYGSERLCHSFPSELRQSGFNSAQPAASFAPATSSSNGTSHSRNHSSSSSDTSLALGDLRLRSPRGVFDPSFSFQASNDIPQRFQPAIAPGVPSMVTLSHGQRMAHHRLETTTDHCLRVDSSSAEVSPMMLVQLPMGNANPPPLDAQLNSNVQQCTYMENCDMAVPMRKVTSHVFGRNKACTKRIPEGAWLHYCRKHYQRTRYRNLAAFARLQLDIVRRQVGRMEKWGGVRDWEIMFKRSEQGRIDKENAEIARGALEGRLPARDGGTDDVDGCEEVGPTKPMVNPKKNYKNKNKDENERDEGGDEEAEEDGEDQLKKKKKKNKKEKEEPPTARWLIPYCGQGKTFQDVRVLLDDIETYLGTDKHPFPPIEILPQIHGFPPVSSRPAISRGSRTNRRRRISKRKTSDGTDSSSKMPSPSSRKRRSAAEDNTDESGDMSAQSPRKRQAGRNTNASDDIPPPSLPNRQSLARRSKFQAEGGHHAKQGKQTPRRHSGDEGGRC